MHLRAALAFSLAAGLLASACNDDGRTLRPARPDQVGTVSAPPDTTTPVVDDGGDDGFGDLTLPADTDASASTTLTTPPVLTAAFTDGGPIDARHTCDGDDVSPALSWTAAPLGTVEIALTLVDLDAPGYVHWALAGIDPLSTSLGEGVVPEFAMQSVNGSGSTGYAGPCPPAGATHRYQFTVHFLAQQTELGDGAAGTDMLAAIEGATFASASVSATYSRG